MGQGPIAEASAGDVAGSFSILFPLSCTLVSPLTQQMFLRKLEWDWSHPVLSACHDLSDPSNRPGIADICDSNVFLVLCALHGKVCGQRWMSRGCGTRRAAWCILGN
mmetsp:Transcript_37069/g.77493  ORF Transcript_37069/g.77493 Transcript_37069/m.77493 type:complete len:107 (-) Transcript_37069:64-384(-)